MKEASSGWALTADLLGVLVGSAGSPLKGQAQQQQAQEPGLQQLCPPGSSLRPGWRWGPTWKGTAWGRGAGAMLHSRRARSWGPR